MEYSTKEIAEYPAPAIAAVSDLSGFGRCSLTVAIAVLSAMGVQCVPLPTAVLSTHTGGFGAVEKRDLTDFLAPCAAHWQRLKIPFRAIYTGYLSGAEQASFVRDFIDSHPESLRVVDPVMGDGGKMYSSLPEDMPKRMREIASGAYIVTPNLTEACLLTNRPYSDKPLTEGEARSLLEALLNVTGARRALITGAAFEEGFANIWMRAEDGDMLAQPYRREPGAYPGTGDIFASVLTGSLARGDDMERAVSLAAEFTRLAVSRTNRMELDRRAGVQFEGILGMLAE